MLQHILILLIVAVAAWYVVRGLRRAATGKTACAEEQCANCPFGEGCGECGAEQHKPQATAKETEPPSP